MDEEQWRRAGDANGVRAAETDTATSIAIAIAGAGKKETESQGKIEKIYQVPLSVLRFSKGPLFLLVKFCSDF